MTKSAHVIKWIEVRPGVYVSEDWWNFVTTSLEQARQNMLAQIEKELKEWPENT